MGPLQMATSNLKETLQLEGHQYFELFKISLKEPH